MERNADVIHRMALDAASAGIVWLVVLAGTEALLHGFVSRFFDMDWLVLWILAATLIAFFTHPGAHRTEEDVSIWGAALFLLGLAAAVVVAVKATAALPRFWRAASAGAVLAAAFLSRHLLKNE